MNPTRLASRRSAILVTVVLAALLLHVCAVSHKKQRRMFNDVSEFKVWAEQHGYFCQSDRQDGGDTSAVAVSTHVMTWEQVAGLSLPRFRQPCEWEGVIRAANTHSESGSLCDMPWSGEYRIWGNIAVVGDPALLDRIERERE